MSTDYSAAVTGLITLVFVLTAMVTFVIARPSDLPSSSR